jgi:hypothetical protein
LTIRKRDVSAQHPSRTVRAGYALTTLLLVASFAFAAFLLVDGAARRGS